VYLCVLEYARVLVYVQYCCPFFPVKHVRGDAKRENLCNLTEFINKITTWKTTQNTDDDDA